MSWGRRKHTGRRDRTPRHGPAGLAADAAQGVMQAAAGTGPGSGERCQVSPDTCGHPYGFTLSTPLNINSTPRCPHCGAGPGTSRGAIPEPQYPCRVMPTRGCPRVYGAVCGARPCARFESDDETPWRESWDLVVRDAARQLDVRTLAMLTAVTTIVTPGPIMRLRRRWRTTRRRPVSKPIEYLGDECEACGRALAWGEQRYLNDDGDAMCLDAETCEARVAAGAGLHAPRRRRPLRELRRLAGNLYTIAVLDYVPGTAAWWLGGLLRFALIAGSAVGTYYLVGGCDG